MSGALNMTLDEIVKRGKTARSGGRGNSRGRGRGGGRGSGSNGFLGGGRGAGPARRGPLAVIAHPSSFSINKPVRRVRSLPWQNGLFEDGLRAAGVSGVEAGTRLHVTNLDQGVTNEDIRELFSEIGELERYAIHYDKNGRPSGTAEVVYPRRSDAIQALKKYNNVLLDGRPMRLEILGGNKSDASLSGRVNVNVTGLNGRLKRTVVIQQGGGRGRIRGGRGGRGPAPTVSRRLPIHNNQQGGGMRGGRGGFRSRGGRGGGGRGRGGGKGNGKKPVEKSAADLDKDLESYHADAMNIS
ncbi:PREDICTED: THO complex subunit 4D [Camelina sativa]|uniref:THO complex subunit 4D n=1 Tax=Camelina sativa TaxID=90675 RepID=A0ABM0V489_CAMSA|nr:PREDICTED: THO complex subunit 4D [Camelina sativa]XP_010450529.1 PREDICTED: THO complex subunit 4D [Camelina sativa]